MHHAVSDGVDLRVVLDASDGGIGQVVEYGFDGSLMVGESEGLYFFRSVGFLEFEESVGESDFLTPPSAMVLSVSVSISLYFTELLPQLSTNIFMPD